MKKLSLLSALLLLLGLPIVAQESISVGETLVPQGRPAMMEVMFNFNESHDYVSYQFTVNLPVGISFVTETDQETGVEVIPAELGDGQSPAIFKHFAMNATSHIVTCASDPSTPIGGSKGVLVRIPIQAEETIESGSELNGTITGVVFATSGSVSNSFEDASFTITVTDKITLDENYAWVPYATEAATDLIVKRTIKANEWSTICLPFAMSADKLTAAFGNYELWQFNGFTSTKQGSDVTALKLNFTKNTKAAKINTPYLIKTDHDITEFEVNAKVNPGNTKNSIIVEDEDSGEEVEVASITGTFKAGTIVPANSLFMSGNNFYYSVGKTKMKGYRAYFTLNEELSNKSLASSRILLSFDDNGTTDLRNIQVLGEDEGWYTISGQKLDKKPTTKGVYIHGGEKVIIKADRRK